MFYFILGFSVSLNIFLIFLGIFIFKKVNVSDKLLEKVKETKKQIEEKNDPWIHSM